MKYMDCHLIRRNAICMTGEGVGSRMHGASSFLLFRVCCMCCLRALAGLVGKEGEGRPTTDIKNRPTKAERKRIPSSSFYIRWDHV